MNNDELSGCGVEVEESYGYNLDSGKWEKQEVPARCGEVKVLVPFGYDKGLCQRCVKRSGEVW
jgi:hypothetical protein